VANDQIVRRSGFQSAAGAADIPYMTGSRCPACGAATPEGVPWCSLCYADLRPAPAPDVPAPTPEPSAAVPTEAPGAVVGAASDPLTAPIATLLGAPAEPLPAAVPAASPALPAVVALDAELDPAEAVTWPCLRCRAAVPLALDACPECGAGFLAGAVAPATVSLPIVGNLTRFTSAQRFGLAAGLATCLIVLFFAIATIGHAVL
jgi:hypothetical protein